MPRLLDSMALALALSACAPIGQKPGFSGREPITQAQGQHPALSATAPSAANKPSLSTTPDGYSCVAVRDSVRNDVTRCCLVINSYKACHAVDNSNLSSFSNDNTINIGGRQVPNYVYFKDGIPPKIYLKYLADSAKSATDLAGVLTAFIAYRDIEGDKLLLPEEIVSAGSGDCDNVANLFVELLVSLGRKTGFDYKAKVLGLEGANHAVAVFLDTDGKWKALDLKLPFREIRANQGQLDLFSASSVFEENKAVGPLFFERNKLGPEAGKGSRIDRFIDPATITPNDKEIAVSVDLDYNPRVNPDTFLTGYSWRRADLVHIHYQNGATAYYRKGVCNQLSEPDKITFYYENGAVTQLQYLTHATISYENFTAEGQLESRAFINGTTDVYANGLLFQKLYKIGPLEYMVYHPSGIVRQKNYRDGRIEWFDENGRLIKKKDQRGNFTELK